MMMAMMGWGSASASASASSKDGWRKGPWTPEEDKLLSEYVKLHGEGRWSSVSKSSGLNRSGKSCRLRWVNYLRPGLKRGQITPQEEGIIIELHALWGNKWSTIARYLPGRTDNEIKNYWRTHFKKKDKNPNLNQEKRKAWRKQQQQPPQQSPMNNEQTAMSSVDVTTTDALTTVMNSIEANQCCPVITQDNMSGWSDFIGEDAMLLGGLWNFDDTNAHIDHSVNCNKMAIQNPAAIGAFPYGGDGDGFGNNGGYYIF